MEMSKPNFQCGFGRLFGRERIGYQRAKPDGGDRVGSMGKRNPCMAERIGVAMRILLVGWPAAACGEKRHKRLTTSIAIIMTSSWSMPPTKGDGAKDQADLIGEGPAATDPDQTQVGSCAA
jgi:hypothetical protein